MRTHQRIRSSLPILSLALFLSACSGMSGLVKREATVEESHRRYQALLDVQRKGAASNREEEVAVSAIELIREGDRLRDQGAPDRAIWQFLRALRAEPERADARERIGFLHLHREPERALTILREVVESHPKRATSHAGIALAAMKVGRLEESEVAARRATEFDPELALGWATLGTVLDQRGHHGAAQGALERALSLRPEDESYLNNLGISYLRSGDGAKAENLFRLALRKAPRDVGLRNELGVALSLQGRHVDALAEFEKAGGKQLAHNNLGAVHLWQGDYRLAARQFEYALLAGGPHTKAVFRNLRVTQQELRKEEQPPAANEAH